jgi:hypothetical protein
VPGPMLEIGDLDFSLNDFLAHLPIQRSPLPHANTCPCSFCDEFVDPRSIDAHLELIHGEFFRRYLHHTEVQLRMADLLGIHLIATRTQKWGCPFLHCTAGFQTFISDHVYTRHKSRDRELCKYLGGFWAPILSFIHEKGKWPMIRELFTAQEIGHIPLR